MASFCFWVGCETPASMVRERFPLGPSERPECHERGGAPDAIYRRLPVRIHGARQKWPLSSTFLRRGPISSSFFPMNSFFMMEFIDGGGGEALK